MFCKTYVISTGQRKRLRLKAKGNTGASFALPVPLGAASTNADRLSLYSRRNPFRIGVPSCPSRRHDISCRLEWIVPNAPTVWTMWPDPNAWLDGHISGTLRFVTNGDELFWRNFDLIDGDFDQFHLGRHGRNLHRLRDSLLATQGSERIYRRPSRRFQAMSWRRPNTIDRRLQANLVRVLNSVTQQSLFVGRRMLRRSVKHCNVGRRNWIRRGFRCRHLGRRWLPRTGTQGHGGRERPR
jgi:hypothetical protein